VKRASTRRSPLSASLALVIATVGALGMAALPTATGCAHQPDALAGAEGSSGPTGAGGQGVGGGDLDAGIENHGAELFAALEDQLVDACITCHDAGGIADTPFLAGPDRYHSIVSWPGVLVANPAESILLTHAVSTGGHSGTNLDSAALKDTLLPAVKAWLDEEATALQAAPVPDAGSYIAPVAPILGFNAMYLDALGDEYKGMALTFNAAELGPATLEISELEVHPTSDLGVHLVHPLFVVYPVGGEPGPDPVDSFSNVDQTFEPAQSAELGPGLVVLTNWSKDAKISIAFETIEPYAGAPADGGMEGGCKDVDSFDANAKPLLESNCFTCHGGANAQANAAVDMSKLKTDSAAACAQVKNRVSPDDPPKSQLFVTTDPDGNAAHPYKFGGSASKFDAFQSSVSSWIAAEK
jgi:hypothetical protein